MTIYAHKLYSKYIRLTVSKCQTGMLTKIFDSSYTFETTNGHKIIGH